MNTADGVLWSTINYECLKNIREYKKRKYNKVEEEKVVVPPKQRCNVGHTFFISLNFSLV